MKFLHFIISCCCLLPVQAQVGIGTNSPNSSSVLELNSITKGLLIPRMTAAQRTAITTPAAGLLVFDTDADNFYFYNGSAWVQAIGPAGTNGTNGKTILSGTTVPGAGIGVAGDFYLNTATSVLYGPKTTTWPAGVSLIGAQGPAGTDGTNGFTILNGTTVPSAGLGVNGDFYLRTTNSQFYGPKTAGAWGAGVSLIGAQGAQGPSGGTNNFTIASTTLTTLTASANWGMYPKVQITIPAAGTLMNITVSMSTATLNNQEVICNLCYSSSSTGPFIPIMSGGSDIELKQRVGTTTQIITLTGKVVPTTAGIYWIGPCYKLSTDDLQIRAAMGYGIILD